MADNNQENQPLGRQSGAGESSPFSVLRRFVRERTLAEERCELCSAALTSEHEHLVDLSTRKLTCACQACAILFSGKANPKYRRVPRRVRYLTNFQLTGAQWDSLLIPIGMAFFFFSTSADKMIALYPGPAGATESLLTLDAWEAIGQAKADAASLNLDRSLLVLEAFYRLQQAARGGQA